MPAPPPPLARRAPRDHRPEAVPWPRPPGPDAARATCGWWRAMAARLNEVRCCSGFSRRVSRRRHLLPAQTHSQQPPRLRTDCTAGAPGGVLRLRATGGRAPRAGDPSVPSAQRAAAPGEGVRMELARHPGAARWSPGVVTTQGPPELRPEIPTDPLPYGTLSSDCSFILSFTLHSLH